MLLAGCCIVTTTHADDIYFTINGAAQGKIGESTLSGGQEVGMRAVDFKLTVQSAPAGIATTGPRQYDPLVLVREPGRGSAQLFHAFVTNEALTNVKIDFYTQRKVAGGMAMVPYQSIRLTNAKVVGFHRLTEPAKDTTGGLVRVLEEVRLVFARIEFVDLDTNVSARDILLQ
jgi:type VI secretion system Hcp family effector